MNLFENKKIWAFFVTAVALLILVLVGSRYHFFEARKPSNYHIAEDKAWLTQHLHEKAPIFFAFSHQLLTAIAQEEEIQITLYTPNIPNLQLTLDEEEFDALLMPIAPTQKHLDSYLFSDPVYPLGPVLIVRKEAAIHDLQGMENKVVGVISGSYLLFNIDRYPSLIFKNYDSPQEALSDLNRDLVDGVLIDLLTARIYTKGVYADKLKIVTEPLNNASLRLVVKDTSFGKELIETFNEGLREIKSNGTYDKLREKWEL